MWGARYFLRFGALSLLMMSYVCFGAQEVDISGNWEGEIQTFGSNSLQKSIALSLEQTANNKVKGYAFYDSDGCIFSVEGQLSPQGNQNVLRADLLEKGSLTTALDGCQHQRIAYALGLSPAGDKLKVEGSHLGQMINSEKSFLTRESANRFTDRLKLLATLIEKERQAPKHWQGVLNSSVVRFLFPAGFASPGHFYVLADQLGPRGLGKCRSSLYYQDGAASKLTYLSEDTGCDILPAGHFNISAENNLKITWQPQGADASARVLLDQDISLIPQMPLTGQMWQLQDVYNQHKDSLKLSQIASLFEETRQAAYQQIDDVLAQELAVSQYSPEFMGAWQGYIRFSQRNKPEQQLEQAALALWLSGSDDRNKILGYLTISEVCLFTIELVDHNGSVVLSNRNERLKNRCSKNQVDLVLPRSILLSMDAEHHLLKLESENQRRRDIPVQGVFQRQKPTPYLMSILESDQGQRFALPDEPMKALMIAGRVPDANLKKQHDQKMQESAELLAQKAEKLRIQEAEAKERERARLKKEHEYRVAARQEKLGRTADISRPTGDPMPLPEVGGPFDGLPGATFLNAVYQGDKTLVQRINRSYNNAQASGLKAFFGSYGNQMTDAMTDLHKHVKIEDSVAAKYLFEYEKRYARCLSESPATFYVTGYQPDMVVTNLLGAEIARYYGGTTQTKYQVNNEFTGVFQKVGKLKPEGLFASGTSWLASQGREDLSKSALLGVSKIFSQFACDSPEVKTFEKNLISLF
jgi:hypothetical protein